MTTDSSSTPAAKVPAPPGLQALADSHNVDLAKVKGTGVGGRITFADVRGAAAMQRPVQSAPRAAVRGRTELAEVRSHFNSTVVVSIDMFAVNPLLDDLRQASPTNYELALSEGPAPTLFLSGDLPIFIACGVDPSMLMQLPWQVRHRASTADPAEFARMLERFAGAGASEPDVFGTYNRDQGNLDYGHRMQRWASGLDVERPLFHQSETQTADKSPVYDAIFGASDAFAAQQKKLAEDQRAERMAHQKRQADLLAKHRAGGR